MTKIKISASQCLVNFLRDNITDINTSRSGQWIFPDFPRIKDLGNANYPRIGITQITNSSSPMGLWDDNQFETLSLQIDVVTKRGASHTITETDFALGTMASTVNSNRMTYDDVPTSITNIKHNTVAFGTITAKDADSDFTTPASLAAGTVEYSKSTGNLNFSAADVASYDTQAITSTYTLFLEGEKQTAYLAKQVVKTLRSDWRTELEGLFYPIKISSIPLNFEEDLGVFRYLIEYQFNMFNVGEGI